MRLGVIDCGTNTFHLLIVEAQEDKTFNTILKERQYVRLGQEGLDKIGVAPFQRGITCLLDFKTKMSLHKVEKFQVFGTEALRRASNGREFITDVKVKTGLDIQLISGEEEARLIHLGVMQAVPAFPGKAMIMDIGGGSVEFILVSQQEVFWTRSFPIGVQVLFSNFQKNDPISPDDLDALEKYLEEILGPLIAALQQHKTSLLIGASGSFEVVEDMLVNNKPHPLYSIVTVDEYYRLYHEMIPSTLQQRYQMPKLPAERAELIVVAFVLIDFVIRKAGIRKIVNSAYAMKEGMLAEMFVE